ncbi:hypothetical protein LBMAG56_46210 [Verrucomicrobiota bacterium]|nr:hypothetical protein LBMAG56_46210 [Verrucomicrobiota bacterium]
MNPRVRAFLIAGALLLVALGLLLLFPAGVAFAEMAARELRVFWWLILLVALAIWLIWGVGRKPRS